MDKTPRHISEILPTALESLKQGSVYGDTSLEDRIQRDSEQQPELEPERIAEIQRLIDAGQATDEEFLAYQDQKALEDDRIAQKARQREETEHGK